MSALYKGSKPAFVPANNKEKKKESTEAPAGET